MGVSAIASRILSSAWPAFSRAPSTTTLSLPASVLSCTNDGGGQWTDGLIAQRRRPAPALDVELARHGWSAAVAWGGRSHVRGTSQSHPPHLHQALVLRRLVSLVLLGSGCREGRSMQAKQALRGSGSPEGTAGRRPSPACRCPRSLGSAVAPHAPVARPLGHPPVSCCCSCVALACAACTLVSLSVPCLARMVSTLARASVTCIRACVVQCGVSTVGGGWQRSSCRKKWSGGVEGRTAACGVHFGQGVGHLRAAAALRVRAASAYARRAGQRERQHVRQASMLGRGCSSRTCGCGTS